MHITSAESQVMEVLWRKSPLSADELVSAVLVEQDWGAATVKTLINRLMKKNAIRSERVDGRHQYRPLIARTEYVAAESQGLLDRLFDGSLTPLISHFAEHRKLAPDDVARLRKLIAELDDDS